MLLVDTVGNLNMNQRRSSIIGCFKPDDIRTSAIRTACVIGECKPLAREYRW